VTYHQFRDSPDLTGDCGYMALHPRQLKEAAVVRTGLSRFGTAPFDEGLESYCWSLSNEAALDERGLAAAGGSIVNTLAERLKVEDCLARNPQILDQSLAPILMIVGLPRTGTTALSQYLSEDSRARSIWRWEAAELVPPPHENHANEDPRIERTRQAFAARDRELPWLQSILPVAYDDTAEHGPLLGMTFLNLQMPVRYNMPSYAAWMLDQDLTPAYAYLEKVMKLLQWTTRGHFWNLKNPPDLFALNVINNVFPDVRYIWTHRDPVESIGSVCSLAAAFRGSAGAQVSKTEIGQSIPTFWAEAVHRAMAVRKRLGEARFVDVNQSDLSRDVVGTIRTLYNHLGIPFSDEYRAKLDRRVAEKPAGRHGKHSYSLEDFGLEATALRAMFAAYVNRFDVPTK
jgi:Sulfotransferase family